MIPKIIHYCWFGGKEKPDSVLSPGKNTALIMKSGSGMSPISISRLMITAGKLTKLSAGPL